MSQLLDSTVAITFGKLKQRNSSLCKSVSLSNGTKLALTDSSILVKVLLPYRWNLSSKVFLYEAPGASDPCHLCRCWWGYSLTRYFWILEGPRLGVVVVSTLCKSYKIKQWQVGNCTCHPLEFVHPINRDLKINLLYEPRHVIPCINKFMERKSSVNMFEFPTGMSTLNNVESRVQ
jgi:hypothetical protein